MIFDLLEFLAVVLEFCVRGAESSPGAPARCDDWKVPDSAEITRVLGGPSQKADAEPGTSEARP
jgi:hypothetical protein